MSPGIRRALGRPALHALAALLAFLAFHLPLLASPSPRHVLFCMYGAWIAVVIVLVPLTRGDTESGEDA